MQDENRSTTGANSPHPTENPFRWRGKPFDTIEAMSTAILYVWVTAAGMNDKRLARGYVDDCDVLADIRAGWGDETADTLEDNWEHARVAVIKRLDKEIAKHGSR